MRRVFAAILFYFCALYDCYSFAAACSQFNPPSASSLTSFRTCADAQAFVSFSKQNVDLTRKWVACMNGTFGGDNDKGRIKALIRAYEDYKQVASRLCGTQPIETKPINAAPVQSRPEKAAKVIAPARKPMDTCNGTLTSNGCVPTPAPPPPPAINTTVGGNQVPPNANQAAPANTSPPAAPSGGYGHPSADCSTITGPGMTGGGPPNCGPTGNGSNPNTTQQPVQTDTQRQAQNPKQQWTPPAPPGSPDYVSAPYDPMTDPDNPQNPEFKDRCKVALQKMLPHSPTDDHRAWLTGEMARSHCYVNGTPMTVSDALKYELQKQK